MVKDEYYMCEKVPEIFKIADEQIAARKKKNPTAVKIKQPQVVFQPVIRYNPNIRGPLVCTQEWYDKKKAKQEKKIKKEESKARIDMIRLLGRKDFLRAKLGELNPGKKKDNNKIMKINIELQEIDLELEMISEQSGIHIDALDSGTKVNRILGYLKVKAKKAIKKVKRFYKENRELINTIITFAIPVIGSLIVKKLLGKLIP